MYIVTSPYHPTGMSSPRDVLNRSLVRSAVEKQGPQPRTTRPPAADVYERDAAAILVPGMSRRDALAAVHRRMALEATAQDTHETTFRIAFSPKYTSLTVTFESDRLVSYKLINGSKEV